MANLHDRAICGAAKFHRHCAAGAEAVQGYPVHRVPLSHETIVPSSPLDRNSHILIQDPGCLSGQVAHCAERGRGPHATEVCHLACQCCDQTDIAANSIMVHKCALCAILGVGNQDGSAVRTEEGVKVQFMVEELAVVSQMDIAFPQRNCLLWLTVPWCCILSDSEEVEECHNN